MLVYNYSAITAEYTGTSSADEDPLDKGNWLIPAFATTTEPPIQKEGFARYFVNGAWEYRELVITTPEPEPEPVKTDNYMVAPPISDEPELTGDSLTLKTLNDRLEYLDLKSIRPLRAISSGNQTDYDMQRLAEIDAEAVSIRAEIELISQQSS